MVSDDVIEKVNDGLVPITAELIAELKASGRRGEARDLLDAFRKSVKEEGKQVRREYDNQRRKINKIRGFCATAFCLRKKADDNLMCENCQKLQKKAAKKYYWRHKKESVV